MNLGTTYKLTITPIKRSQEEESTATAVLEQCFPDGSRKICRRTTAYIGRNGTGKEREGDGRTPCGDLHIFCAFGIMPNPGTKLDYIDVTPDTIACDTPGPYYNRIVDRRKCETEVVGEEMFLETPAYDYGLVTDYNMECIYPLGSAIFLHCKGKKPYTAGCIAFDREFMKQLVILAGNGLDITINK